MRVRWRMGLGLAVVAAASAVGLAVVVVDQRPRAEEIPDRARPACERAMAAAQEATWLEPLDETLDRCESVAEWLAALRNHPVEFGGRTEASVEQLRLLCGLGGRSDSTRVCRDAEERNLL